MAEYDQDQAWLVTLAAEETVVLDTGRMHVVPAWRFRLYDELPS